MPYSLLIIIGILAAAVLAASFICFRIGFYSPPRKPRADGDIDLPEGEIYEPYWDSMRRWAREAREMGPEEVSIRSHDGLTLRGKYYECRPGAPIELMFHGYRGSAERIFPAAFSDASCWGTAPWSWTSGVPVPAKEM